MRLGEMEYALELEWLKKTEERYPLKMTIPLFHVHRLVKLSKPLYDEHVEFTLLHLHAASTPRPVAHSQFYDNISGCHRLFRELMFVIQSPQR